MTVDLDKDMFADIIEVSDNTIGGCIELSNEDEIHNQVLNDKPNEDLNIEFDSICGSLVGMTRQTLDMIYELYCQHARCIGFGVRKGSSRFSLKSEAVELSKVFVCSCSGIKRTSDSSSSSISLGKKKKNTNISRTCCKAMLRANRNEDGLYVVVKHVIEHNHQLTRVEWNHFHRSERKVTVENARVIEDMMFSGMKASESFRYLSYTVGGEENLGHTIKDHYNFVHRWKSKIIEGGDSVNLIEMLQEQASRETDFFYKVKMDSESRLVHVFWRDSMMKEDFDIYGDVMVFDTTYRTNRYSLICAPFVGVNNHWKNCMFGCAFISNEKAETFEWLFDVFKKSMQGKCPVTIFTDQDLAISNAIEKCFPESRHRLCLWHIYQNAVSRFGALKTDCSFKDIFNKCLSGCGNEEEFERCWQTLITEYKLEENDWFKRLYSLKQKWCTALNKNSFSAGILSSQRSESANHAIGFSANQTTSLTDFYDIFRETVKRWRRAEQQDEFTCSRVRPDTGYIMSGIVWHASQVYTLTLFTKFNKEFMKGVSASSILIRYIQDTTALYKVTSPMGDSSNEVIFYSSLNFITCDCLRYEEFGMLCYHSLRVLLINSFSRIPEVYIKTRWTKLAKSHVWDKFGKGIEITLKGSKLPWTHRVSRTFYNIALSCEEDEDAIGIIEEGLKTLSISIDALKSKRSANLDTSTVILDPACSKTKGRGKRIKGPLEMSKKNKKKDKERATILVGLNEFGSITPNPRLFTPNPRLF